MPSTVHFQNFLGPGTLCGIFNPAPGITITSQPEKVTCERCLALMGRSKRSPAHAGDPTP
jgi:hypothetical protein